MPICNLNHRYDQILSNLPDDKDGQNYHKCANYTYLSRAVRHKSTHFIFMQDYSNDINLMYN